MKEYKWEVGIILDADNEEEAQERIEEAIEDAQADTGGLFSYGTLTLVKS